MTVYYPRPLCPAYANRNASAEVNTGIMSRAAGMARTLVSAAGETILRHSSWAPATLAAGISTVQTLCPSTLETTAGIIAAGVAGAAALESPVLRFLNTIRGNKVERALFAYDALAIATAVPPLVTLAGRAIGIG